MDQLDSAKVAGLMVIASIVALSVLRKGFAGVSVRVGS
jgi:hypothetical protein